MKVVIIGAGIIGITSALRLLEAFPEVQITIITEEYSPNTTSDVSAGYWKPLVIEGYNMHLIEYLN
jgi:D-amino-acid oxidase